MNPRSPPRAGGGSLSSKSLRRLAVVRAFGSAAVAIARRRAVFTVQERWILVSPLGSLDRIYSAVLEALPQKLSLLVNGTPTHPTQPL